jgi:hypothetical protein
MVGRSAGQPDRRHGPVRDVLWFDPLTGYLVINYHTSGPTNRFTYIDPEDGSVVDTFTTTSSKTYFNVAALIPTFHDRLISKPGFVAMFETSSGNDVVILNIQAKTFATFASDLVASDGTRLTQVIVDQSKALYISANGAYAWTVHQLPGSTPGLVSLQDIVTKVMFLAGYGPSELTFEGFSGLSGYGFVIASDTNVRTAVQSIADIYGFSFADIGSGFYFKKPGQDEAFAFDATLTTADLVFGDASRRSTAPMKPRSARHHGSSSTTYRGTGLQLTAGILPDAAGQQFQEGRQILDADGAV